jgi:antitoxin (DNA-binding transcriptional repressor) of toxin-antitoxin stability system
MRTASVSEILRDLRTVLDWVKAGEEVEVMEGEKPVALISPPRPRTQHPDYAVRLHRTFGAKTLSAAASEEIRDLNRGDR